MAAYYNGPPNGLAHLTQVPSPLVLPPTSALPYGLQALHERCASVYPDQTNPLQVTAVIKYW